MSSLLPLAGVGAASSACFFGLMSASAGRYARHGGWGGFGGGGWRRRWRRWWRFRRWRWLVGRRRHVRRRRRLGELVMRLASPSVRAVRPGICSRRTACSASPMRSPRANCAIAARSASRWNPRCRRAMVLRGVQARAARRGGVRAAARLGYRSQQRRADLPAAGRPSHRNRRRSRLERPGQRRAVARRLPADGRAPAGRRAGAGGDARDRRRSPTCWPSISRSVDGDADQRRTAQSPADPGLTLAGATRRAAPARSARHRAQGASDGQNRAFAIDPRPA